MLRSDLCDYSDAYIVVKGKISVTGTENTNRRNKKLTFKNNAPFTSCISKVNNTLTDNAEDLDIFMPIYNLLEYSDNFSMTSGSFWNYYRDKVNDSANEIDDNDNMINNKNTKASKSFVYKTKITGSISNNNSRLNTDDVVPLKHLSNFWRSLDLPLINCGTELSLRRTRNCVITEVSRTFREVDPNVDPVEYEVATLTTSATFQINNDKLYVPVITLSINNNIIFLENIKQGFKRTIS